MREDEAGGTPASQMNMTEQPLQLDAISPLVAALCDGTIGAQDFARLEQLLADDAAARRWYIDYMDLHDELFSNHCGGVQGRAAPGTPSGRRRRMMNAKRRMMNRAPLPRRRLVSPHLPVIRRSSRGS